MSKAFFDKQRSRHSRECLAPPFSLGAIHAVSYTRFLLWSELATCLIYAISLDCKNLAAGTNPDILSPRDPPACVVGSGFARLVITCRAWRHNSVAMKKFVHVCGIWQCGQGNLNVHVLYSMAIPYLHNLGNGLQRTCKSRAFHCPTCVTHIATPIQSIEAHAYLKHSLVLKVAVSICESWDSPSPKIATGTIRAVVTTIAKYCTSVTRVQLY